MKITIIGTGYVGLVTATCFAEMGNSVYCLDINKEKIDLLNKGKVPIFEPGLEELISKNTSQGRLSFTTDSKQAIEHGDILFIAVGTPSNLDGTVDLKFIIKVINDIGNFMNESKIIVTKSTVPIGTGDKIKKEISKILIERKINFPFYIVSNPEFLKEGTAINDFLRPERVLVGCDDANIFKVMKELYKPFVRNPDSILTMDLKSAELSKYAANAMLATRISFMNELALLAERVGADIENVRFAIGADSRIGSSFLYAGCGYGGSCFPKDLRALINTFRENINENDGLEFCSNLLEAVEAINESQKKIIVKKVINYFGNNLSNLIFAVWGLSFKPDTDDMRDAPSRVIIKELVNLGAKIKVYDPIAIFEGMKALEEDLKSNIKNVTFVEKEMDALENVDALILVTEWKSFRSPDFKKIKSMLKKPVIFDGRNIYNPELLKEMGFEYFGIGRKKI